MQKSFNCPHCDKKYPVLPTLVGRKVRCTACKNVFQLQYDGIAIKVGGAAPPEAPSKPEPSALESKSPSKAPLAKDVERSKAAAKVRPQTQAIRRKTERIKKIRSSLQDAAEAAVESVAKEPSAPSKASARQAAEPKEQKRKDSMQVVLTNSGNKEGQIRFRYVITILIILGIGFLLSMMIESSIERQTLEQFTAELAEEDLKYPRRMEAYRERMLVYTRDGLRQPPILLNADDGIIAEPLAIDWTEVVAACAPELEDLELSRRFALWHDAGQSARIEELWGKHPPNQHIEEFYLTLQKEKINFLRFEQLQPKLIDKGLSKQAIYVASLLLAGTRDAEGRPCLDKGLRGGIMPSELVLFEFSSPNGHLLIHGEGSYRFSKSKFFCGLIAGFSGFPQQVDEWRVLDFRTAQHMDAFYGKEHNPLILAAAVSHQKLDEELGEKLEALKSRRRSN